MGNACARAIACVQSVFVVMGAVKSQVNRAQFHEGAKQNILHSKLCCITKFNREPLGADKHCIGFWLATLVC